METCRGSFVTTDASAERTEKDQSYEQSLITAVEMSSAGSYQEEEERAAASVTVRSKI